MAALDFLFFLTTAGIILFSLDDLVVDAVYWIRSAWRFIIRKKLPPLTLDKLNSLAEKKIALMIPCWKEGDVIPGMIRNTLASLRYTRFHIFVGVYPNDEDTRRAVSELAEDFPQVHAVLGPRPGPTTKADNLNAIIEGVRAHEIQTGESCDIYVMHDSEDVIHPLSFKLYNYLIPHKDMVQIPVFPLEAPLLNFTHWSYADEFAENHTKDMIAREWMGGFVPSAGVGTAFSRHAIDLARQATGGNLFNSTTLTEDYSFSLLLNRLKLKSVFVHQSVKRLQTKRRWYLLGFRTTKTVKEWVATRSLFPLRQVDAIRQKSRWILGIALQEWQMSGWDGEKATRYSLVRDRKAPLGHLLILSAYGFLIYWLVRHVGAWINGYYSLPPVASPPSWMVWTVICLLSWRLIQRMIAVWRIYGAGPAILSAPRVVVSNFINVEAFLRAFLSFSRAHRKKETVAWAKTTNRFPTAAQLTPHKRKLGDILLESNFITPDHLAEALKEQKKNPRRLGELLVQKGVLSENDLLYSLGRLFSMDVVEPEAFPDENGFPEEVRAALASLGVMPLSLTEKGLVVGVEDPADFDRLNQIRTAMGAQAVKFVLIRKGAPSASLSKN